VMANLEKRSSSHIERFLKTLFALSRWKMTEDGGFGDLLSRSQMHINDWDEVALPVQQ
jgi:hypothetical protein